MFCFRLQNQRSMGARRPAWPRYALLALLLLFRICLQADEPTALGITARGVQQADDESFVSADYKFMPGETVYVTFRIIGFHVKAEEDKSLRSISLSWEASAVDSGNVLLAPVQSGEIQDDLSPQDKQWTPMRRTSFVLPQIVPAGEFHIHIVVKDVLANAEASKDVPFRIGGPQLDPSDAVVIQHVRFSREEDGPPLELAAYRPGDTAYAKFEIAGFSSGQDREYHVSYGLTVLAPDGKVFLDVPNAAEFKDTPFYPAKFLPGTVEILTKPTSARGNYVVILTAKDLTADKTFVTRRTLSLE